MTSAANRLASRTKIADLFNRGSRCGLQISVTDGRVRLCGIVHSWPERSAARKAAWSIPGAVAVEDWLRVVERSATCDSAVSKPEQNA